MARRRRRAPARGPKHRWWNWVVWRMPLLLIPMGLVALVAALYAYVQFSQMIILGFEGRRWSLSSKVYAEPESLYPGLALRLDDLQASLERLGYRSVQALTNPGQYRLRAPQIDIALREFRYPYRRQPSRSIRVSFARNLVHEVRDLRGEQAISVVDLEPQLVSEFFTPEREKRQLVNIADIPPHLIQAVIAIEDRRFYAHRGIDWLGILRATYRNVRAGGVAEGGSTLTQQLVKNFFLTPRRSIGRKGAEMIMAVMVEARYSKAAILELYLNEVYFGQRGSISINGIGEATRLYFRKGVKELTIPEAALLAGLIRAPHMYSPYKHPARALARRNRVLTAMLEEGYLTPEAAERARHTPLRVETVTLEVNRAPYFIDFLRDQLLQRYSVEDLTANNLTVFTSLDLRLQAAAQRALEAGLLRVDRRLGQAAEGRKAQGALIAIQPQTGFIRALVGGRDYATSQFNRVTQARRQMGSVFKPIVYAAALESAFRRGGQVITALTRVEDVPTTFTQDGRRWTPHNYDGRYLGWVGPRTALEQSLNVATVKFAERVGFETVAGYARRMGMQGKLEALPSLALGTFEASPFEVAQVYAVLANHGLRAAPLSVKEVMTADARVLEKHHIGVEEVLQPATAFLVTDFLTGVFERGTARSARRAGFRGTAAGKTGTTDEARDAWFAGYTPDLLVVVWVGYDDASPLGLTGAQAALPIWVDFMKDVLAGRPSQTFHPPPGLVQVTVDPATGEVAHIGCPTRITEVFIEGTEPRTLCALHSTASRGGKTTSGSSQLPSREGTFPRAEHPEATSP
ncbi:MAG TPA: PBP1A family penicillin-binding protein [Candidatus Tectomicrobia bacterium]|nr:PBP1A family penicillin-binding protein [Candidatus Tectomicrobia bacterium]